MMLLAILSFLAGQDHAVPEGVHSDAKGPVDMCGLKGPDVSAIRLQVEKGAWVPADGGPRFMVFNPPVASKTMTQWVFTKPSEPTHPSVTCRKIFPGADGSTMMERKMRCDGSRADCDKLFLEFQELDERAKAAVRKP